MLLTNALRPVNSSDISITPLLNEIFDTSTINISVSSVAPSGINASDIRDVYLRYINNTIGDWVEISINNTLWGVISGQKSSSTVTFQIIVENYGGSQNISSNYTFTVRSYRPYIAQPPSSPDIDGDVATQT